MFIERIFRDPAMSIIDKSTFVESIVPSKLGKMFTIGLDSEQAQDNNSSDLNFTQISFMEDKKENDWFFSISKLRRIYKQHRPEKKDSYHLIYFDTYGKGEAIRMLMNHADIEYEETRILPHQWKLYKDKMPYQNVPVLEIRKENVKLSQS